MAAEYCLGLFFFQFPVMKRRAGQKIMTIIVFCIFLLFSDGYMMDGRMNGCMGIFSWGLLSFVVLVDSFPICLTLSVFYVLCFCSLFRPFLVLSQQKKTVMTVGKSIKKTSHHRTFMFSSLLFFFCCFFLGTVYCRCISGLFIRLGFCSWINHGLKGVHSKQGIPYCKCMLRSWPCQCRNSIYLI